MTSGPDVGLVFLSLELVTSASSDDEVGSADAAATASGELLIISSVLLPIPPLSLLIIPCVHFRR